MKKFFLHLFLFVCFTNCNLPKYVLANKTQTIGVDFTSGKWLVNDIDAPKNVVDRLTELVKTDFEEILKNRFIIKSEANNLLIPIKIKFQPSKKDLKDLKKATNFDFLVNIKATTIREDFSSIDVTPKALNIDKENRSEVILEIYDLNTLDIVFSQKVIATTRMAERNSDVHFSKSSRELQLGAYKKLFKNLKKKSIQ